MKQFKQILSLISEAKFEKGGQDVGKMFGPSGKYAPKKGPKEPTAAQRMKSGNITPNINRPSGLEIVLQQNPPEESKWVEGSALQRSKGKRPDLGEPIEPAALRSDINRQQTLRDMDKEIDRVEAEQKKKKSGDGKRQKSGKKSSSRELPIFTNNMPHPIESNAERLKLIKKHTPHFIDHSNNLTENLKNVIEVDYVGSPSERDRRNAAHMVVDEHFRETRSKIKKSYPLPPQFGTAVIKDIIVRHAWPGTKSMSLEFHPLKTNINSSSQIERMLSLLRDHTGHEWYVDLHHGNTEGVGTKRNPLLLSTDVNHPYLGDPEEGGGGGGDDDDKPETPKPKGPSGKAPIRPRTPSLV